MLTPWRVFVLNVSILLFVLVVMPVISGAADGELADALDQLSPAHRTVLVETFYRGRTLAKVARQLGIPDSTARSRLHHAQALRRQLEDREAIEPR